MAVTSSEVRATKGQEVIKARKTSETVARQAKPDEASQQAAGPAQTHWMDRVALWVWVFGIGSLALISLIDLAKSLFVR
jgi:hypothetical protein